MGPVPRCWRLPRYFTAVSAGARRTPSGDRTSQRRSLLLPSPPSQARRSYIGGHQDQVKWPSSPSSRSSGHHHHQVRRNFPCQGQVCNHQGQNSCHQGQASHHRTRNIIINSIINITSSLSRSSLSSPRAKILPSRASHSSPNVIKIVIKVKIIAVKVKSVITKGKFIANKVKSFITNPIHHHHQGADHPLQVQEDN